MSKFLEQLAKASKLKLENKTKGTCVKCGEPFSTKNVHTQAGWEETKISGLCEDCFDNLFEEE